MSPHSAAAARTPGGSAEELDLLALAYGIEPEFTDVHGILRRTEPATKRALLHAMGVAAGTPHEVRAARAGYDAARWERPLPPVVVAPAGSVDVPLVLPRGTREVAWRVALEAGGALSGKFEFGELPLVEARDRDGGLERRSLHVSADVPLGYHRLSIDSSPTDMPLIITPHECWLPPSIIDGGQLSGIAIALYLLRSAENWGIGDFTDLRTFVELVAARGGDLVGLNPLHQMFVDDPEKASPYSPASRLLLNVLNIDVSTIPEFAQSPAAGDLLRQAEVAAALAACRAAPFVAYSAVAGLKLAALRLVYATFRAAATPDRQADFARYRSAVSPTVEQTFVFTALREFFAARDSRRAAWQDWPPEYRDPGSAAVARFAHEHAAAVTFAGWLQWVAEAQLAEAAAAARPMRVGLYRDLAVGGDPAGAETWCNRRAVAAGARIGAPPDIYNPLGQNWDLPPFDPHALRAEGYASFIELVRANMRHAGALRIDHVMALQHLYWIPQGAAPRDGAYVRYGLNDLIGILALESQRAQCLVVGEDLGTVPAGFRERMRRANILSYRVLFFERDEHGTFNPPATYPRAALGVLGSHDLPPLAAWWSGADLRLREELGLLADPAAAADERRKRAADRTALSDALRAAAVLGVDALGASAPFAAVHAFLAQSAAALAIAQLDDVTGETEPVNVPTTSHERPNWRRRFSLTLEELAVDPRLSALFDIFGTSGRLRTPESAQALGEPTGAAPRSVR